MYIVKTFLPVYFVQYRCYVGSGCIPLYMVLQVLSYVCIIQIQVVNIRLCIQYMLIAAWCLHIIVC